jgi:hypothetical protein
MDTSITWITSPGGAGKTTLVVDYLAEKKLSCLWYQIDERDGDIASFFYYMSEAAKSVCPRFKKDLPLLTPEYLQGLSVFTKTYFEELFRRLTSGGKKQAILVFDNFQDALNEHGFHDVLTHILEIVSEGIKIFVLSRLSPPSQLARLKANRNLRLIQWNEIRFNREESDKLIELQNKTRPENETLDLIHQKTDGWAAGLVLLSTQMKSAKMEEKELQQLASDDIFDYLAREIFEKTQPAVQDLLLKTSFCSRVTIVMAERLTGNKEAGSILTQLYRDNYFTQRHVSEETFFQYHPLFKEFLQSVAGRTLSGDAIREIKTDTAVILEEAGKTGESIELYLDTENWEQSVRLILVDAMQMLGQGLNLTLEGWLRQLPDVVHSSSPWLSLYLGVCQTSYNLLEARKWFEQGYAGFKKHSDAMGAYFSWCGIIETYLFSWGNFKPADQWIKELDVLRLDYPDYPNPDIELRVMNDHLAILMFRHPQHPELQTWMEQLEAFLSRAIDPMQRLTAVNNLIFYYHSLRGNMFKLDFLLERLEPYRKDSSGGTMAILGWEQARAACLWQKWESQRCFEVVSNGLYLADEEGVHLWDFHLMAQGIFNAVSSGHLSQAQEMLTKMKAMVLENCQMQICEYHYLSYLEAAHRNDVKDMEKHSIIALAASQETGVVWAECFLHLTRARALFVNNEVEAAWNSLRSTEALSTAIGNDIVDCGILEERTLYSLEAGEEEKALEYLQTYMTKMYKGTYINTPWWRDDIMACLCSLALEHGIEPEYARNVIRKRKLIPPDTAFRTNPLSSSPPKQDEFEDTVTYWANWPYPVKIHTKGEFRVELDDQEVTIRHKQLAVLNVLVAQGGSDVKIAGIVDFIWTEVDGDKAYSSFTTTLSRLRKLLGENCFVSKDGTVSINRKICWVDAFDL